MNEILLYLSLKYSGNWMAVYNSLQRKEKIQMEDINHAFCQVKADYTTLLEDVYPEGLKSIYKPPFGIFSYGNYKLLNNKNIFTIFGNCNEDNLAYIQTIKDNGGCLLWVDLSNREMIDVLNKVQTNNIFWIPELKNQENRTFNNLIKDEKVISNNLFFSELWEFNPTVDYSSQLQERLYLGISHKALVLTKLSSKQLFALANYASTEDILVIFKKDLFDEKNRKLFTRCKVELIDENKEITKYFFAKI